MTKFSLNNKRALITGGGSGIGRAISLTFAEAGASIVILDIDEGKAGQVMSEIEEAGGHASVFSCDITNQDEVLSSFRKIEETGPLDILVNNAGIAHVGNIENTSIEEFRRVLDVNVIGTYNCIHACIPSMRKNGGGVILNIASTVASVAIANRFAYTTSKGAVLTLTYSVALDFIQDNIRCNALSPGRVHTPFVDGFIAKNYPGKEKEMFEKLSVDHPIGRMAKPQEIANLALFLCSDEASYITGSNHHADGGFVNLRH